MDYPFFDIKHILIYNPLIKPKVDKPNQEQIQQAKIIYYYPINAMDEEKRNQVGLIQGIWIFFNSIYNTKSNRDQVIYTNKFILILIQPQQNIFFSFGIEKLNQRTYQISNSNYMDDNCHQYYENEFSKDSLIKFAYKFYHTFYLFYGQVINFSEKKKEFDIIMSQFVPRFLILNQCQEQKKLNILNFILNGQRSLSININFSLKINFFFSIIKSIDPDITDIILLYNGYLIFSTMPQVINDFFLNYLFIFGDGMKIRKQKLKRFVTNQKFYINYKNSYGYLYSTSNYGYFYDQSQKQSLFLQMNQEQLMTVSLDKLSSVYSKLGLSFYWQKNIMYLIFSSKFTKSLKKIIDINIIINDNLPKFKDKMQETFKDFQNLYYPFRFIYTNLVQYNSIISLEDRQINQIDIQNIANLFQKILSYDSQQMMIQYNHEIIYAMKSMNRIYLLILNKNSRIQDQINKFEKYYFYKFLI